MDGEDSDDNPADWNLEALNWAAGLIDRGADAWHDAGNWNYPEQPSWVIDADLDKPHELRWLDEYDRMLIDRMR